MRKNVTARFISFVLVLFICIGSVAATGVCSVWGKSEIIGGSCAPAVFVSDTGTGDGSSPEKAISDLRAAFSLLAETGGYAVVCGPLTLAQTNYTTPRTERTVTVTSFYDGVDYRERGARLSILMSSYFHSGSVKYEYINIEFSKAVNIYMQYNDLHIGDEVSTSRQSASGTYRYPILIGGKVPAATDSVESVSNSRDTVMRIDSGTWDTAFCGNNRSNSSVAVGNNSGRSALIINGGHFTRTQDNSYPVSASGMNYFSGDVYLEINGGVFDCAVFAVFRTGTLPSGSSLIAKKTNTGNVLVRITGGEFNNTVGLTRAYDASAGNDAYLKNYVVNGDAAFVITGGSFKGEFITYCACGDLLLKYDAARVQSDFLSLCSGFPIKQKIDSTAAPDTASEYVRAEIDQQIDKQAHGADPYVIKDPNDDCYYYVYSSGGVKITKSGNIGLFKQGPTSANDAGINNFTKIYNGVKIVNSKNYSGDEPCTQFWAPEIHYIPREVAGDDYGWYCYVAASDSSNTDAAHRMYVYKSPDPDDPMCQDWVLMGKITDSSNFWAIDGTVIVWKGEMYFAWSGRESSGLESAQQNICIAKMKNPWTLSEQRSILSTPSCSWERYQTSPAVNEGPQAFEYDGRLYLTYSANGSWAKNYCVGILSYDGTGSLSDVSNWTKRTSGPFFSRSSSISSSPYGTGHGSVVESLDGGLWMVFHANPTTQTSSSANWWSRRMIYAQPLSFGGSGAIISNYAQKTTATNTIAAHNTERCTKHFWVDFDYPSERCLYCGSTRDVRYAGDMNGDGYISNSDLTLLIRYLSGYGTPVAWCDVDRDGKIDNRDGIELIRILTLN